MVDKRVVLPKKANILVIGDIMLDKYLWGNCERISPEAPVQLIDIKNEEALLGGAGNVLKNIQALEANATILSVIGKDNDGKELQDILDKQSINYFIIKEENRKTTKKSRIIATHSQVIRYDNESRIDICEKSQDKLFKKFKKIANSFDLILLSDYAKGVLTTKLTKNIIKYANSINKKVLIDPKGKDYSKYNGAYLLTPNKTEIKQVFNIEITDNESLKKALQSLKKIANIPLITLSESGIAYFDKDVIIKPTVSKNVYDVTGAGDTVLATLGYCLANNMNISDAIDFANIAAGIVVAKIGAGSASLSEIKQYGNKHSIEDKIKSFNQISKLVENFKKQGKKIVFTNGCFDILHYGHTSYLHQAKHLGDILIVGLNNNDSVKKIKGKNRPINNEDDRAFVLSSLNSVDYVVKFPQKTPYKLIQIIKPDILTKGDDYKNKKVIGSNIAKQTKLIKLEEGKSTSSIIKKIRSLGSD